MKRSNKELNLEELELKTGNHKSFEDGSCVMEMVSYLANEPWSDHPKCACPLLTSFAIFVNDNTNDIDRQRLKSIIPKLLNSKASIEIMVKRAMFFSEQANNVFVPLAKRGAKYAAKSAAESAAKYAAKYAEYAAKSAAEYAAKSAAEYAAKYAEYAAESAAKYAAKYAEYAAKSAAEYAAEYAEIKALQKEIIDSWFDTLDKACDIK